MDQDRFVLVYTSDRARWRTCAVPSLAPLQRAQPTNKWVRLPNGERIRPTQVISVARETPDGRVVAAWVVAAHGVSDQETSAAPATPAQIDWPAIWRRAAALMHGWTAKDPHAARARSILDALDQAFQRGDRAQAQACLDDLTRLAASPSARPTRGT